MTDKSLANQASQDNDLKKATEGGDFGGASPSGLSFQSFLKSPKPDNLTPNVAIQLQRTIGNQALMQLLRQDSDTIQRNGNGIDKLMSGRLEKLRDGNVALLDVAGNHIKNFANDTKGQAIVPDAKGLDRIIVKAKAKIQTGKKDAINVGDDIKDILRGTIVYETFDQMKAGYMKVFKTLSTYGLQIIKAEETYTDEGKQAAADRKNTKKDESGYGDAKMVFNLDIPKHINKKYFEPMMFDLPKAVPVELQFQTKAGLAVKSGQLYEADPDGKWNYRIDPKDPNDRWRFDASKFVDDIITKMENKGTDIKRSDYHLLISLGNKGLPPAHDVYDPVKKAALSDEDIANADKYYPQIYELAFRYSGKTDTKAQGLNDDVKRVLKRIKK